DDRCADAIGGLADAREVDHARIRARANHDHLRLMFVGEAIELVVIDPLVLFFHAVRDDRVQLAGKIQWMPMREVAAVRQVHAEDGVAGLEQREVHRHVRLRARMRLHVGMLGAEQCLRPRDGGALDDVDVLAAAVIAATRVAFGVFVREHRTGGFEDRTADEVLRRDQFETVILPVQFVLDGVGDLGIRLAQAAQIHRRSASEIWSMRRWWRPPSNFVLSHSVTISSARPLATMRPPIERTFASLCSRDSRAVKRSLQSAARTPGTLFAAICSPWPLPPRTMPRSARPSATLRPTAMQIGG